MLQFPFKKTSIKKWLSLSLDVFTLKTSFLKEKNLSMVALEIGVLNMKKSFSIGLGYKSLLIMKGSLLQASLRNTSNFKRKVLRIVRLGLKSDRLWITLKNVKEMEKVCKKFKFIKFLTDLKYFISASYIQYKIWSSNICKMLYV